MDERNAKELLIKYREGKCTDEEKAWVETFYLEFHPGEPAAVSAREIENAVDRVGGKLPVQETKVRKLWPRVAAVAASILILLTASLYFYQHRAVTPAGTVVLNARDIKAGENKPVLTLADGSKITLEDSTRGRIAAQGNMTITKTAGGQLIYTVSKATPAVGDLVAMAYNTVETPAGRLTTIRLPDGSEVTLNAGSKLEYPVNFKGKERLVELTGEAYFSVVLDRAMPFRVKTAGQLTEDLGTHFNINAYSDEPGIKTTLLEGSVKVMYHAAAQKEASVTLLPGQQSALNQGILSVKKVNTSQAVAWKNGLFEFNHTDLYTAMRQISRWYNLQIVYEGEVKGDEFFGEVDRKYNLAEALKVLETSGLHFRVEGSLSGSQQKRLIVMP